MGRHGSESRVRQSSIALLVDACLFRDRQDRSVLETPDIKGDLKKIGSNPLESARTEVLSRLG